MRWHLLPVLLLASLLAVGCGASDIGEECDEAGASDECVDDAVCTNESDGNRCRKICFAQTDCPGGTTCNGVSGSSIKSCQPDK